MEAIVQTILTKMGKVRKPELTALIKRPLHRNSDGLWESQLYESQSI